MPSDPLPADKDGGDESKPSAVKETDEAKKDDAVSSIQKKIRRAEQFGMPVQLSEEENRNSRAERSCLQGCMACTLLAVLIFIKVSLIGKKLT
ncbi:hypothetical protein RHGRI_016979 [Rhododendron griersonianum]|uniref:THO1-MOS11 C-terminal domain-containing protein n=1 Tax=Rhododendron griersonianum TaxID=479676 RepID=A0AAV6JW38_9ERIC|nr:hypothetical protein RHGRI_016979 [Rhododendron griersonianum]